MNDISIRKMGREWPLINNPREFGAKYPWRKLAVGDWFEVPCWGSDRSRVRASLNGGAQRRKRDLGERYRIKTFDASVEVQRIS